MSLVVFLRGVNVGGHRRLRPSELAAELGHLGAVNVGATGILVIRKRVSRGELRAEIARRVPFAVEVVICEGREIVRLLSQEFFAGYEEGREMVRFVSVLSRRPRVLPRVPLALPGEGEWLVKVLACEGRFVVGLYRREMRVLRYLAELDEVFGVPLTTRSWGTLGKVEKVLRGGAGFRARRCPGA